MVGSDLAQRLKANPYGITEVYRSENPLVDIVFVHGLNGHPHATWATKDTEFFWPAQLLPRTLQDQPIRVLTFGYDATVVAFMAGTSKDKLHNHAERLAAQLHANRSLNEATERPIIFVAHSLGGLVVKRTLTYCSQLMHEKTRHLRSIFISTHSILFMGTPHNGSDMAKWGSMIQSIFHVMTPRKIMDSSDQLLKVLKSDNEHLQNINRDFTHISKNFYIYFFHESKPMDLKGTHAFVVDERSAAPTLDGVERMGIEADHGAMCRFKDENAPGYEAVAEAILRYSTNAVNVIPARWEGERAQQKAGWDAQIKHLNDMRDSVGGSEISLPTRNPKSLQTSTTTLATEQVTESMQPSRQTPTDGVNDLPQNGSIAPKRTKEPLHVLPSGFHPNSTFYGMRTELDQLHSRLFDARKRHQGSVAVLLYAGPGAGKTYLARQYMYEYQSLYPGGIFWVDSKTPQSRANGYWHIAHAASELKDDPQSPDPGWFSNNTYVDKVRLWLESREHWLLIFDGITFEHDAELTEFKKYLPFQKNTSIIYTSVDRTLSKKSRLFDPYGLQIKPLTLSDARKLLYKELGIKFPTPAQERKATALVKHYEYLPLAIHAISHRLVASGKSLERYEIESHLTDQRLAGPYQGIMRDLATNNHIEALNLINLLSFFGHNIPVGMILFGRKALSEIHIEIRSLDRLGSSERHFDNTLAILIKYGLIERTLDPYVLSDQSSGSSFERKSTSVHSRHSPDSEGSSLGNFNFVSPARNSIDIVKVHAVVQGFCRDELKVRNPEDFYQWLDWATALFCRSYTEASARIKGTRGPGHVRDYREYQTHARRLVGHFPSRLKRNAVDLRGSHIRLHELTKDMENEIENRSPSSSQESVRHQKSIFDSATSISSEPSTPASGSSRNNFGTNPEYESPDDVVFPSQPGFGLPHPVIQVPAYPVGQGRDNSPNSAGHSRSPSQATEVPPTPITDRNDDEGWQTVASKQPKKKGSRLWDIWSHRFRKGRGQKDLGTFRHAPAEPILSNVHGTGSPVVSNESSSQHQSVQSLHSQSPAESMLAGIRQLSPPPSRGRGIRATSRTRAPGDSRPTYTSVISPPQTAEQPDRRSFPLGVPAASMAQMPDADLFHTTFEERPLSDPSLDTRQDRMTQSAYSDPGFGIPENRPEIRSRPIDTPHAPYPRTDVQDWQQSNIPEIRNGNVPQGNPGVNFLPLPYEADIPISRRQQENVPGHSVGSQPRASFRHNLSASALPHYYGSLPISRGASQQSTQSLHTEPSRIPPKFSPEPAKSASAWRQLSPSLTNMRPSSSPSLNNSPVPRTRFGMGESGMDSDVDTPTSAEAPAMSRGSSGPGMAVGGGNVVEFGRVPASLNVRFDEQDPISVDEPRWRAERYEGWLESQPDGPSAMPRYTSQPPYPRQNLMPTSSDAGQLETLLDQTEAYDPSRGRRGRSGSSPARTAFPGLGLYDRR